MVQTPALVAKCRVVAHGQSVAAVEALATDDDMGVSDCWPCAGGGKVSYQVASLAVVVIGAGNGQTLLYKVGVTYLQGIPPLLLPRLLELILLVLWPVLPLLLLMLLMLLLLLLL